MKYLVLLLIVLAVYGWLRTQRRATSSSTRTSSQTPQDMTPCLHCGVHIPRHDALTGRLGAYCSAEHRQQHEG